MPQKKIAFVAASTETAQQALIDLQARYGHVPPDEAELIVALGGDGFMLRTLHRFMTRQLPVFGITRIGGSLVIGGLIDRFGSIALLAIALTPLSLGLLGVALGAHAFWWLTFMALAGISTGANGALSGTIWAELYGQRHLGAIRSLYQALMVLSAGLAPLVMGVLIDLDLSVESVLIGLSIILILASLVAPARRGQGPSVRG